MAHLGGILGWSRSKSAFIAAGIQTVYRYEQLGGWRRMVSLRMPSRRNALGGLQPAHRTSLGVLAVILAGAGGRPGRTAPRSPRPEARP
jgi:hypothetical protein